MIRQFGAPTLEQESFQRMMNIVYLEARISAFQSIKKRNQGKTDFYKYDLDISKLNQELKGLTQGLEPEKLMQLLTQGNVPRNFKLGDSVGQPWPEFDVDLNNKRKK